MTVTTSVPPSSEPTPESAETTANAADDETTEGTRWGAGPAFLALIATFGVTIFVGIPGVLIGEDTTAAKIVGNVVSSVLQNAAFVGIPVLILVLLMVGPLRRRDFGLQFPFGLAFRDNRGIDVRDVQLPLLVYVYLLDIE